DMPFMSYQADHAEAMRNAGRFLTEGLADAVKLEVSRHDAPLIEQMTRAGIPVIAHFGTRPQQVKTSGYRISGKTADEARDIVDEAIALEAAGACMLLIEATPAEVAQRVVERTSIPVIGCGAGPACHGQIVVLQDILGLSPRQPSFATPMGNLGEPLLEVARTWIERVRINDFKNHPYYMPDNEAEKF
ncbi:MAG: 3-methyl-2-oxobutanoate hydroxymethyltransferase, partial [Phycisphaerales bacterium]|nr:3-methyl-2-oxobutanoate hydroxymethyltransferase [Phycisphaerales bacterium]